MDKSEGVFQGIENEQYHRKIHAISASGLKLIGQSPAHYREAIDNPPEQTPAMAFGSAFHSYLLEPDTFYDHYAVMPEGVDRRTKAGKLEYETFIGDTVGKAVISQADYDTLQAMRDSAMSSQTVRGIFSNMKVEQSVLWRDPTHDFWCKARPDIDCPLIGALADLKTAQDASPDGFSRAAANFGYHIQAAHYLDGWNAVSPTKYRLFFFIVIEKMPPYALAIYEADAAFIERGRERAAELKTIYARCLKTNTWPGYGDRVQTLSLPGWVK
jgi:hypothetical protein